MFRNLTLALSSLTLCSTLALAGNPEAEGARAPRAASKPQSVQSDAILVKRDNNGIKQFFKITKAMTPKQLAAKIEILQKQGQVDGIVAIDKDAVGMKSSKTGNAEAEQATAKTAWFGHHHLGGMYYGGYWPQTYFYNPGFYAGINYGYGYGYGYNNYGYNNYYGYGGYYPYNYGWSYGCQNYTYGVYWR